MKRVNEWLFDTNRPLRFALVALVLAVANALEATYVDNPRWRLVRRELAFCCCWCYRIPYLSGNRDLRALFKRLTTESL
jgi:hypothetical protein